MILGKQVLLYRCSLRFCGYEYPISKEKTHGQNNGKASRNDRTISIARYEVEQALERTGILPSETEAFPDRSGAALDI